ncbi:MAG: DUF2690 domain-containing protein [Pseudonocardiaceae bacterium]
MSETSSKPTMCGGFGRDGKDPQGIPDARTVATTSIHGRTIELRYSDQYRTAWGTITHGQPGDNVWVDRSDDDGQTWQQLGQTWIQKGSDTHTPMYDADKLRIRAGGNVANRPEVAVTEWH